MMNEELNRQRRTAATSPASRAHDGAALPTPTSWRELVSPEYRSCPELGLGCGTVGAQEASPSPAAAAPVELGTTTAEPSSVAIAKAEQEVTVLNDVVVAGFKESTGGTSNW